MNFTIFIAVHTVHAFYVLKPEETFIFIFNKQSPWGIYVPRLIFI